LGFETEEKQVEALEYSKRPERKQAGALALVEQ